MDRPGKYCCFLCPSEDYDEKLLSAACPTCGKPYGFPLQSHPDVVKDFRIIKPLGRGFYSATFLVESGELNRRNVLKIAPKAIYDFFKKDFPRESRIHRELAQESEHIIDIEDYFEATLSFGGTVVDTWVSVLQYVKGISLREFLTDSATKDPMELAQVAIDLFRILAELDAKLKRHNDLHGENLIVHRLEKAQRPETIANWLKVHLIDLGSVADESKSDGRERLWDRHWVALHLEKMISGLLDTPDAINPLFYRLCTTVAQHVRWLYPPEYNTRQISPEEAIDLIRMGIRNVKSPWRETSKEFRRFSDTYNAQSLDPWFVPSLIVDPEEQWEKKISSHGPQIITGMRGCGKTMFLKSLHFHSRAAQRAEESEAEIIKRLAGDRYVGLYASTQSLLTRPGGGPESPGKPIERLLILYVKDALFVLRHLQEIDPDQIVEDYTECLKKVALECLGGPSELADVRSDMELEMRLQTMLFSLERQNTDLAIPNPIGAFSHLSDNLRGAVPIWNDSQVLFLLDDMSTRYLSLDSIGLLTSSLLFQRPNCAFKITTERQTYEEILRSPGLIEQARPGRDYEIFDLGAEVYSRTRRKRMKGEKPFVEVVLERRIKHYDNHPPFSPAVLLGSQTLKSIAENIAKSSATSKERKQAYCGINVLSQMCVGDIGDVILVYEEILKRAVGEKYPPIPANIQTDAFLSISSDRLWRLDRRETALKDFAHSFAQASHALLLQSWRQMQSGEEKRLRQYSSIYVRITSGDAEIQFRRLRDLIDAGIFVFQGGAPRTKTRDADPSLQFKLVFRKLFGLSSFMGLSNKDRFELSGQDLEAWINSPGDGKQILMRNLGGADEADVEEEIEDAEEETDVQGDNAADVFQAEGRETCKSPRNLELPFILEQCFSDDLDHDPLYVAFPELSVSSVEVASLAKMPFDYMVFGLGFEERTAASAKLLMEYAHTENSLVMQYEESGRAEEILGYVNARSNNTMNVDYGEPLGGSSKLGKGRVLVDITGLAKPAIFGFVRRALVENGVVWVCRTQALQYYPTDEAIAAVLGQGESEDRYDLLKAAEGVLTGERGPYKLVNLYTAGAGDERRRVICAFSSPKHERLMKLLDERGYDKAEIISHPPVTPRGRLARLAAQIAIDDYRGSNVTEIESDDLEGILDFLKARFQYWYTGRGFNFEVGLTGSKLQAVACASASAALQFTNVWYVAPREFDSRRFTVGVGKTSLYELRLSRAIAEDESR